jgi:hypothetical protein
LYGVWVKIDETMPWIELKGTYPTKHEARKAAREAAKRMEIRVVPVLDKGKTARSLTTVRAR